MESLFFSIIKCPVLLRQGFGEFGSRLCLAVDRALQTLFIHHLTGGNHIIEIGFGNKTVKVEVLAIADTTKKEEAKELFRYI